MKAEKPVILFCLILLTTLEARAVPAFARKYRISCMTCHAPSIPKLKAYGNTFAGDGLKLEEYESPGYFTETGDDKLSLIRRFPLAVRFDGFVQARTSDDPKVDLSAPFAIKLLSGGALSEHLSYYFYFYLYEGGEIAGVEDAYLMYDNFLNSGVDIFLGQFQVSDPLFKRELRLTHEDYRLYTAQIGLSDISMAYDRGIMLTYTLPKGTNLTLEIVNGNGLSESDPMQFFDKDKYKSFLGRISRNFSDGIRLGVAGYYGKEDIHSEDNTITNQVYFAGPDATFVLLDKFELNLQYLVRHDSRIYATMESVTSDDDLTTHGVLCELIYSPIGDQSDWYTMGLYNLVESDYDPADYQSATVHFGYLLRRNVRFSCEYTEVFTHMENPYGRLSFGFVSAF
jgi:hypothetical protein